MSVVVFKMKSIFSFAEFADANVSSQTRHADADATYDRIATARGSFEEDNLFALTVAFPTVPDTRGRTIPVGSEKKDDASTAASKTDIEKERRRRRCTGDDDANDGRTGETNHRRCQHPAAE